MKNDFLEVQRFSQWWLWLMLISIAAIPIWGACQQLIVGRPFGDKPMSDVGLIVLSAVVLFLPYFFWKIKLETTIDDAGIEMKFFPFANRKVTWGEVKSAEVLNYGFVGGWGLRFSSKYGTIYNVRGSKGLALTLQNGNKIVIGTQREKELRAAIQEYMK